MEHEKKLKDKIKEAPGKPGCYLFYDAMGNIIYVGKSKRLNHRVASYFHASVKDDERIADLIPRICDVSYVETETELDALIEEYHLIKKYKPWFNAQHIRSYQPRYLRLRNMYGFPTLSIVDGIEAGERCLGPFRDAYRAEDALRLLNEAFHTPLCGKDSWAGAHRTCLHHEMGRCYGPCSGAMGNAVYPLSPELDAFAEGNADPAIARLTNDMREAASALRFEEAQAIKATIEGIRILAKKLEYGFTVAPDSRALLMMRGYGEQAFSLFHIEEGEVTARVRFSHALNEETVIRQSLQKITSRQHRAHMSGVMAGCLQEISAYKRIVFLQPEADESAVRTALSDLYKSFCGI